VTISPTGAPRAGGAPGHAIPPHGKPGHAHGVSAVGFKDAIDKALDGRGTHAAGNSKALAQATAAIR
jgi:hypothetical protein